MGRTVGIGSPPEDQLIPGLPEYELDKSTGEIIKVIRPESNIKYKWEETDFD